MWQLRWGMRYALCTFWDIQVHFVIFQEQNPHLRYYSNRRKHNHSSSSNSIRQIPSIDSLQFRWTVFESIEQLPEDFDKFHFNFNFPFVGNADTWKACAIIIQRRTHTRSRNTTRYEYTHRNGLSTQWSKHMVGPRSYHGVVFGYCFISCSLFFLSNSIAFVCSLQARQRHFV